MLIIKRILIKAEKLLLRISKNKSLDLLISINTLEFTAVFEPVRTSVLAERCAFRKERTFTALVVSFERCSRVASQLDIFIKDARTRSVSWQMLAVIKIAVRSYYNTFTVRICHAEIDLHLALRTLKTKELHALL